LTLYIELFAKAAQLGFLVFGGVWEGEFVKAIGMIVSCIIAHT